MNKTIINNLNTDDWKCIISSIFIDKGYTDNGPQKHFALVYFAMINDIVNECTTEQTKVQDNYDCTF